MLSTVRNCQPNRLKNESAPVRRAPRPCRSQSCSLKRMEPQGLNCRAVLLLLSGRHAPSQTPDSCSGAHQRNWAHSRWEILRKLFAVNASVESEDTKKCSVFGTGPGSALVGHNCQAQQRCFQTLVPIEQRVGSRTPLASEASSSWKRLPSKT